MTDVFWYDFGTFGGTFRGHLEGHKKRPYRRGMRSWEGRLRGQIADVWRDAWRDKNLLQKGSKTDDLGCEVEHVFEAVFLVSSVQIYRYRLA